jgi:hypothetical protein
MATKHEANNRSMFHQRHHSIIPLLTAAGLAFLLARPAAATKTNGAGDWGYGDGQGKPPENEAEEKTNPSAAGKSAPAKKASPKATINPHPTAPAKPSQSKAASNQPEVIDMDGVHRKREAQQTATANANADREKQIVKRWLELYTLVAADKLSDDQQLRFSKVIAKALNGPQRADFEAIQTFWPLVQKETKDKPDQKDNFRDLFRCLMRLKLRNEELTDAQSEILAEVLGPVRVAVPGSPTLYEDAVEAYADMACFMYTVNHPGKTVDGLENRTIFAAVIYKKFNDAPTLSDKIAMVNFGLKWSKFKILYSDANAEQKEKLVERISGKAQPGSKMNLSDSALDAALAHGPWVKALNANIELKAKPAAGLLPKTPAEEDAQPASDATANPHN